MALADDATGVTWWNPAGLATGAYLSALFEYGESRPTAGDDLDHRSGSDDLDYGRLKSNSRAFRRG